MWVYTGTFVLQAISESVMKTFALDIESYWW